MIKKSKLRKSILFFLFFILLVISLNFDRKYLMLEKNIRNSFMYFNSLLNSFIFLSEDKLDSQDNSYVIQKELNKSLNEEIVELKDMLKLNKTLSDYDTINATVVSRNSMYWLNKVTVDKGFSDGIRKGMAVITYGGLIGIIDRVYANCSDVKLITSDDITYKTSVIIRVDNKDYYAILNGYVQDENLLKVSAIDKSVSIKKGDKVLTSGLGNLIQGIYVGEVVRTEIDKYNLGQVLYIKSNVEFNNLHYLTVLKEKK